MANRLSVEESKAAVADEGAPDPLLELLKTIRKHNEQYARQDRDREPAAELPERIRREREEQSSPTVNGVSKPSTTTPLGVTNGAIIDDDATPAPIKKVGETTSEPIERQLTRAREEGYTNGWDAGKTVGYKIGVEKGKQIGKAEGLAAGRKRGKEEGLFEGLEKGKKIGFDEGLEVGRNMAPDSLI